MVLLLDPVLFCLNSFILYSFFLVSQKAILALKVFLIIQYHELLFAYCLTCIASPMQSLKLKEQSHYTWRRLLRRVYIVQMIILLKTSELKNKNAFPQGFHTIISHLCTRIGMGKQYLQYSGNFLPTLQFSKTCFYNRFC